MLKSQSLDPSQVCFLFFLSLHCSFAGFFLSVYLNVKLALWENLTSFAACFYMLTDTFNNNDELLDMRQELEISISIEVAPSISFLFPTTSFLGRTLPSIQKFHLFVINFFNFSIAF